MAMAFLKKMRPKDSLSKPTVQGIMLLHITSSPSDEL
jgi:hypothetical protein